MDTSLQKGPAPFDQETYPTDEIAHALLLPPADLSMPVTRILLACVPGGGCVPLPAECDPPPECDLSSPQLYGRSYVWYPDVPGRRMSATPIPLPANYPVPGEQEFGNQDWFCGGHDFMKDGRLLWAAGTDYCATCTPCPGPVGVFAGHRYAWILDHGTDPPTWSANGYEMQYARWYPTVTQLGNGDLTVLGHALKPFYSQDRYRDEWDDDAQGFVGTAFANADADVANACSTESLIEMLDYPRVHLLRNRMLMQSSANAPLPDHSLIPVPSRFLDVDDQIWSCVTPIASAPELRRWTNGGEATKQATVRVAGGSAHLITWIGNTGLEQVHADFEETIYDAGGATRDADGDCSGLSAIDILDTVVKMTNPGPSASWVSVGSLVYPRANLNLVIGLEGALYAVGGHGVYGTTCAPRYLVERFEPVEVFPASAGIWLDMAAQEEPRMYHSSAVLEPRGRFVSSGGKYQFDPPTLPAGHSVEMYYPKYFYATTARPVIDATGLNVTVSKDYGEQVLFDVQLDPGATLDRVALLRNGAATHGFDMAQRYVELALWEDPSEATPGSGLWTLSVLMPIDAYYAPQGYYMLTVVDSNQVPAEAVWIRLEDEL